MRRAAHKGGKRPALTLLEVIIALAIFLFSLAAITQLLSLSGQRALEANLRSQGNLMCQSKLAEVVAGAQPLQAEGDTPFPENPDWTWRLECQQSDLPGLWNVQVFVKKERADRSPLEVSLGRMVLVPTQPGSSSNSSTTNSGSGSSSTGSTSGGTP